MDKLIKKRLGSALIIFAVVTAFLTGIVGYSASQIFGSSINALTSFSVDSVADNYAMSQINQFRNAELGSINDCNRQAVAGSDKLYQTISHKDENGMRYITLQIFYDNETTPRSQFTMRKSLSGVNPDARPIYQTAGSNTDGSMSQKAVTDTYLQKKDAVTRVTGQAVGSSNQGVYMNSKVVAGDNVFRLNQNNGSNNIGVITEVGDGKGGTLKYIDYVDKSQVMSDIQLSDSSNTSNGYIKFGKDLVFAWKQAGMEESNKYYTITKPYAFKTLYSGMFDVNRADQPSVMTGVWANMRTKDTADVYYMQSAEPSEMTNIFWFGYSGEKELPAIPVPMRTLTVGNTENQQIVVRVEDIYGTYYTLTNGQSGNFPEGSSFTVSVNASSPHYIPGTPNITEGLVYTNTNITASAAVLRKYDFTVPETEHQTVIVTAKDAQTGQTVTIKSGETKQISYSSQWTAVVVPDDNFIAGTVTPSNSIVAGNTSINVTNAIFLGAGTYRFSYARYSAGSFITANYAQNSGVSQGLTPVEISLAAVSNISYVDPNTDVEFDFVCPYSANKLAVYFSWHWGSDESGHVNAVRFINLENNKELYSGIRRERYDVVGGDNACSVIQLIPGKKYRFRAHISGSYYKSRNYGIILAYGSEYNQFPADVSAD